MTADEAAAAPTPHNPLQVVLWLAGIAVAIALLVHFHPWESDLSRAERLRTKQAIVCFEAENSRGDAAAAQAKCDIATREFNRFMNGR